MAAAGGLGGPQEREAGWRVAAAAATVGAAAAGTVDQGEAAPASSAISVSFMVLLLWR